jgi:hypothetical protein
MLPLIQQEICYEEDILLIFPALISVVCNITVRFVAGHVHLSKMSKSFKFITEPPHLFGATCNILRWILET